MNPTEQTTNARRSRKKVNGSYSRRGFKKDVLHPLIQIGGLYLERFGFHIGDEVDITCKRNTIVIRKVKADGVG